MPPETAGAPLVRGISKILTQGVPFLRSQFPPSVPFV